MHLSKIVKINIHFLNLWSIFVSPIYIESYSRIYQAKGRFIATVGNFFNEIILDPWLNIYGSEY
jgi:hypothetical protein